MMTPLPARSAKTPDLHRSSPLEKQGWAAYFRFGNSADRFGKISEYARMRMALFIAKRARRSRKFGWAVLACRSPDQLGLITLSGIVVAPYPFRDWRVKPNAAGERRR
jgi:RNA-directed DNA polymerase